MSTPTGFPLSMRCVRCGAVHTAFDLDGMLGWSWSTHTLTAPDGTRTVHESFYCPDHAEHDDPDDEAPEL